jgi:hypothetical protein
MSHATHPGHPDCPRLPDEDLGVYMERYSKWEAERRPWQRPVVAPKEEPRMPYADRDPGEEG